MRYIKFQHDEHFIDDYPATFFYELDSNHVVKRSVEFYESGILLKYDESHFSDEFGMLPDQPMPPMDSAIDFEQPISKLEFESFWRLKRKLPNALS